LPTGAVDLLPTVLTLLGLPLHSPLDGRVLWELFERPQGDVVSESQDVMLEAAKGSGGKVLLHKVGPSTYVHGALQPDTTFRLAGKE
jgi:hypothetical protein